MAVPMGMGMGSQLATWMSGYSLVYITVCSTVHSVLYIEVFST